MRIRYCQVIDGLDTASFSQLLDGRNKAFRSWVKREFWHWSVVCLAPLNGLQVFLRSESSCLTIADEP